MSLAADVSLILDVLASYSVGIEAFEWDLARCRG